jgi:hypothetical protein
VWIDLTVLMLGKVGEMRLAPDGSSPGPPDGVQLSPTGVVGPYCGFPTTILGTQLILRDYATRTHPWDWRKTVYPAGVGLATRIRQEVRPEEPCTIVAHSAGGLVARAAWTELGLTGQTNLIRRIITCGTPHWGSYTVVAFWSGSSQTIDLLRHANQVLGYNTFGRAPDIFGYRYLEPIDYQRLALTWPGFYDTLPVLGAPDAANDPNRAALYDAANWPEEARPQQAWLDWSRDHTGPWLRSAASQPPSDVLTCLSGGGKAVPGALADPGRLGQPGALGGYVDGDGAVTLASAELATGVSTRYVIDHENFLATLSNNGDLVGYVVEERTPAPPPPPVVDPEPQTTQLAPLPFADAPFLGAPSMTCATGKCAC